VVGLDWKSVQSREDEWNGRLDGTEEAARRVDWKESNDRGLRTNNPKESGKSLKDESLQRRFSDPFILNGQDEDFAEMTCFDISSEGILMDAQLGCDIRSA
jgi:hypothetical protein